MRLALVAIAVLFACAKGSTSATTDGNGSGKGDGTGSSNADAAVDAPANNGCAVQPCTIDPQCGCTDPQHPACDLGSGSANACRYATTTGVEGATCSAPQGCAAGYTCVGGGSWFDCEKYCGKDSECISPRGQCVVQLTDGTNPIPGAVVCSSNCDPSTATNALCPAGWTCDLFTATYMAASHNIADCRIAGTQGDGAACSPTATTTAQMCIAGYSCVNTGSNVCKKICNKTANTGCTTGTCTSFTTALTIGGTEYGVCL